MGYELKRKIGDSLVHIKVGDIANQSNGAVIIQSGETMLLITAVMSDESSEDSSFFPLQVNYSEKFYAAGKIPGGYIKREGRPRDKEVLISRMIDRPIRPLFPSGLRNEVQILISTISFDQEVQPDILAIIGVSAALTVSDIPFYGPLGAIRIGLDENQNFILNPSYSNIQKSSMDLVVVGKNNKVLMLEGSFKEVKESIIRDALDWGTVYINEIISLQEELRELSGKEKVKIKTVEFPIELKNAIYKNFKDKMEEILLKKRSYNTKLEMKSLKDEILAKYSEDASIKKSTILEILDNLEYDIARNLLFEKNVRVDGRSPDEIREITLERSILPRAHGSAIFKRGETKSLGIVTLGTNLDAQKLDDFDGETSKRFMLHYNFYPFSVGEVSRLGSVSRREIGHGNVAEKALVSVMPEWDKFPYTIRIVSEILESNGSSSMASISSACLALLDAGIPISKHVAGIAMGLMVNENRHVVLTDIQGIEDKLGDMDFKIAGTEDGVTVIQLDIKLDGISNQILFEALEKSKIARNKIISKMVEFCPSVVELSQYAPRVMTMNVKIDKIKDIIGPSGRVIKKMIEDYNVDINIDDKGFLVIIGKNYEALDLARNEIERICEEIEMGKIYNGIIKKITAFGLFIEVLSGKSALCPISKMPREKKVSKLNIMKLFKINDSVKVKCTFIDKKGRAVLSMI